VNRPVDISGNWALKMEGPQGLVQMTLAIEQIDGELRGTVEGPMGSAPLTGTVDGETVAFSMVIDSGPGFEMSFEGTLATDEEGEVIRGTMHSGDVSAEFVARRTSRTPTRGRRRATSVRP
jgi:hypothetical protein